MCLGSVEGVGVLDGIRRCGKKVGVKNKERWGRKWHKTYGGCKNDRGKDRVVGRYKGGGGWCVCNARCVSHVLEFAEYIM